MVFPNVASEFLLASKNLVANSTGRLARVRLKVIIAG
jgi:hypothetical protein